MWRQTVSMSAAKARFPDASLLSQRSWMVSIRRRSTRWTLPRCAKSADNWQQVGDLVQQKTPTPAQG